MKKIKRLELRTGQVLNPLQQNFVVGGKEHKHNWATVNGCICSIEGMVHKAECTNTETAWSPDWSKVIEGATDAIVRLIPGGAILSGGSGIGSAVAGFFNYRKRVCLIDMELTSKNPRRHNPISGTLKYRYDAF